MATAQEAAEALVAFDRDVAEAVLAGLVADLDGPSGASSEEALAFLTTPGATDGDGETTAEWKAGFARRERMRALGIRLAKLLAGVRA